MDNDILIIVLVIAILFGLIYTIFRLIHSLFTTNKNRKKFISVTFLLLMSMGLIIFFQINKLDLGIIEIYYVNFNHETYEIPTDIYDSFRIVLGVLGFFSLLEIINLIKN